MGREGRTRSTAGVVSGRGEARMNLGPERDVLWTQLEAVLRSRECTSRCNVARLRGAHAEQSGIGDGHRCDCRPSHALGIDVGLLDGILHSESSDLADLRCLAVRGKTPLEVPNFYAIQCGHGIDEGIDDVYLTELDDDRRDCLVHVRQLLSFVVRRTVARMPDLIERPRIDRTVRRIVERIDESTQLIDQAMSGFRSGLRGAPIRPHREGDSATLGRECRAALTDDRDLYGVRFHGFEFRTKVVATAQTTSDRGDHLRMCGR